MLQHVQFTDASPQQCVLLGSSAALSSLLCENQHYLFQMGVQMFEGQK